MSKLDRPIEQQNDLNGASIISDEACDHVRFSNEQHALFPDKYRRYGTEEDWEEIRTKCPELSFTAPIKLQDIEEPPIDDLKDYQDSGQAQGIPDPSITGVIKNNSSQDQTNPSPSDESTRPEKGIKHQNINESNVHEQTDPKNKTDAGDPVDIFNGALYIQETDLEIPNTIVPLVFSRFYRSGAVAFGPFGWNWDHNYNLYIRELNNGNIALWRNLHEDIFTFDGANFEPPRGIFEKLTKMPGIAQAFEVSGKGGVTMRFERPAGWIDGERIPLIWIKDRHGNQLTYSYSEDDKLKKVTDDDGRFFLFNYGTCGLLTSVEDHAGRKYSYGYDRESRHLVCICSPSTTDHPEGIKKIYHYEKPFTFPELRHNILRIEDNHGRIYLENKYEQDPASWSYARVTEQLYGGFLFQFCYTQLQWVPANPIYINIPAVRVEVMNPDFGLETYTFNYRGDLLDHRWRLNKDKSFRVVTWQYEYDEQGNLTVITKPDGSKEINTFDDGNPDPRKRNNLLQRELTAATGFPVPSRIIWRGKYEPNYQLLIEEKNEKNAITKYQYDFNFPPTELANSGKLKEIIYPDTTLPDGTIQNCTAKFEHNAKGQITANINPDGTREELVYGNAGNETSRLINKTVDLGGLDIKNHLSYDNFGFIEEQEDGNGNLTKTIYNSLGQLEQQVEPAINGVEATTFFHYDADKKMISTEKPKGTFTGTASSHIIDINERDVLGYPTKYILSENTPEKRIFKICNDYRGNPIEVNNPDESVVKRIIDERGLLVFEEQHGVDGKSVSSKNVYDRSGRLTHEIDSGGLTTIYDYDGFGRIKKIKLPNGSYVINTWGENDLLSSEEVFGDDGQGAIRLLRKKSYDYDEKDRKIKEIISSFEDDPNVSVDLEKQFFYNEMDRITKIQDIRGAQKKSFYDNAGRLIREMDAEGNEEHFIYDKNGNIIQVNSHHKEPSGATTILSKQFSFDARNRREQIIEPDGATSSEQWDDRNLVVEQTNLLDISNEIQYNSFGEKVQEIIDTGGLSIKHEWSINNMGRLVAYCDPSRQVSNYTYDSLGRLEKIEYPNGFSSQRTYNNLGLVIKEELGSGVIFEYSFDAANRLKTINNTNSPVTISSIPQHQFCYDGLDRVVLAKNGSNQVLRTYDSLSRITSETTNGDVIRCTYNDINGFVDKIWPDGRTERYSHNLNGVVANIKQINTGNLGTGNGTIAEFLPSGPNNFGQAKYKNNFNIGAAYDQRKRLVELTMSNGGTTNENLKYRYDSGNRKRVEAIIGNNSKISLHNFDTRNRLIDSKHGLTSAILYASTQAENDTAIGVVQGNSGTAISEESFSYNNSDERIKYFETGSPDKNYTYSEGHRIQSDGMNIYSFHTDGTLRSDGVLDYHVDSMGRVVQIEQGGNTILNIEYDAYSRASIIQENGKAKLSFNYFGNFIEQENYDDVPFRQFTLNPITGIPIAYHVAGDLYYTLFDERYNLVGLTDSNGKILETYRYKSFGIPTIFEPNGVLLANSRYNVEPIFGGQRYFNSLGLYLSKRRILNPVNGIFLAPDPFGYIDSSSLYVYVGQNPISLIDPDGELAILATILIGAAIGAALSAVANWDKSGADFWVSVGAGAVAGGIMGTGFGIVSFAAGGLVGGAIQGGYENGLEGAITQGGLGLVGGIVGGAIGGRVATSLAGKLYGTAIAKGISTRVATQGSQYIGTGIGGFSGGFAGNATQQSIGYTLVGEDPFEHLSDIGLDSLKAGGYGFVGGVSNKALIQGYSYYTTRSYSGMIGAEAEFYVENQSLQKINRNAKVPNINGIQKQAKVPDLYGKIIGDVKNTSKIPSLSAQNNQLRSINQEALLQGKRMTIFHRPGVTAGPKSQVGQNPNIDQIPIRQHTPPYNSRVFSK